VSTDPAVHDVAPEVDDTGAYRRIVRIRRALIAALTILVVLLLLAFVFLLRIFQPVGTVASTGDARGIEWVRSIYGWGNTRSQQLGTPQSVAFAPNGVIWVTDAAMSRLIGFNPDGSYNSLLHQGPRGSSANALSFPSSVAVDESGVAYIGDNTASEIVVMSAQNTVVRKIPVPRPKSVAVRGDRLVVGSMAGFVIMSKTGDVIAVVGAEASGIADNEFNVVSGVAIGADGTIYALDQYNNRISAYDRDGRRRWIRVTGNPGNQTTPQQGMAPKETTASAAMQLPSGIAIDGAGRLVVVDAFGFDLVVLEASDGDLIARYGDAGAEDGKFVYPSGIAYDPARDYFAIADTSMGRVQIVRIPGSGGSAVATVNRALLGPLRACLVPLALLFVVTAAGLVYRSVRRRRRLRDADLETAQVEDETTALPDENGES
jgi:sugar lactone lactonase YvrE